MPELNTSLSHWHSVSHRILWLFIVPGVCSSVLRKDWKCTVPAAALGSGLLPPGMILLVFEDAKSREGIGGGQDCFHVMWVFSLCKNLASLKKQTNKKIKREELY